VRQVSPGWPGGPRREVVGAAGDHVADPPRGSGTSPVYLGMT
jgi:hypothetical protein